MPTPPSNANPEFTETQTPLYDPTGHQFVAEKAYNVATDGTSGIVYGDPATAAGGGGGGAITVADGADVTQGTSTDANTIASVMGRLTKIRDLLNATLTVAGSGNFTVAQATGSNLHAVLDAGAAVIGHVIADSGSTTAVTSLPAIPTGSNVIGHVINDAGAALMGGAYLVDSAGTNKAAVDSNGNQAIKGNFTEVAGNGTGVVNGANTDLISSTDVSAYKFLSLQVTGTWTGTLTFQCSNDNVNWSSMVLTTTVPTTTNYSFQTTINGFFTGPISFRYLRVRMTAYTSNTSLAGTLELYTQAPAAFNAYAYSVQQGTWTAVPNAATTGGATSFHLDSAASTNATSVKASAGQLYGFSISNANAAARYVHFYNKASTPTVGTDVPVMTVLVPPTNSVHRSFPVGEIFAAGIAFGTSTGLSDTDSTAVGLHDLSVDLDYK